MLGEGTLVAEAAVGGDFAQGALGGAEESARGGDTSLHQEFLRGQAEDATELALEGTDGEAAFGGERLNGEAAAEIVAHTDDGFGEDGEGGELAFASVGRAQDTHDADDLTGI